MRQRHETHGYDHSYGDAHGISLGGNTPEHHAEFHRQLAEHHRAKGLHDVAAAHDKISKKYTSQIGKNKTAKSTKTKGSYTDYAKSGGKRESGWDRWKAKKGK